MKRTKRKKGRSVFDNRVGRVSACLLGLMSSASGRTPKSPKEKMGEGSAAYRVKRQELVQGNWIEGVW